MLKKLSLFGLLLIALLVTPAAHANEENVVVRLLDGADIGEISADTGATILGAIPELNLYRMTSTPTLLLDKRVAAIYADGLIDARPSYFVATGDILEAAPADATVEQVEAQTALDLLRVSQAHTISRGAGITVAVLDTGVEFDHPLLTGHLADGYDFVSDDAVADDVADNSDTDGDWQLDEGAGHGSHVAGIIASVAPDATILPVRIFDSNGLGLNFNVAQGIVYAVNQGADVINLSGNTSSDEPFLQEVINYAAQNGVIVVVSAGLNVLGYPASYDSVISVAATDNNDWRTILSRFSSGDVTTYAPGEQVLSAYHGGRYARWTGHSMATPFVAGTAALMLATGSCDAACVQANLMQYARPIDNRDTGQRLDVYDAVGYASQQEIVTLETRATNTDDDLPQDNARKLWLQIDNQAHSLPLSELTMRYWYQNESDSAEIFTCDWAAVGCENVTGTFGADRGMQYLEIGFVEGIVFGSADSGQIQLRTHHVDWASYDETNDYSYNAVTDLSAWENVTTYHKGELAWGIEPAIPTAVELTAQATIESGLPIVLLIYSGLLFLTVGIVRPKLAFVVE